MNPHTHSSRTAERIQENTNYVSFFLILAELRFIPGTVVEIGDEQLKNELQLPNNAEWRHIKCSFSSIQEEMIKSLLCKCHLCINNYVYLDMPHANKMHYKFKLYNGNRQERMACLAVLSKEMGRYFSDLGYDLTMTITPWNEEKINY